MITSNKEEILSKVDGIVEDVKEVKTKVKDLTLRVETQEETNAKVNKELKLLQCQISNLKDVSETVKAVGGSRLVSTTRSGGASSTPLWPAGPSTQSGQSRAGTGGTSQAGAQ